MERTPGFFKLHPLNLDLGDMLVQIFAVALGVILGFAVTAWNERVHQRALLHETVANIAAELKSNQSGMHVVMKEHAKAADVLAKLLARGRPSMTVSLAEGTEALRETGYLRVNVPLAIAWQIAQSDQGLTLLPYQDRYDLAWVYQLQTTYYQREERYENSLFGLVQSQNGNYFFQVLDMANQLRAIVATEKQLDATYTTALKRAKSEFKVNL